MPAQKTGRLETRVTLETAGQVKDLTAWWGGIKPLSQTDVIAEAIDRAWKIERAKPIRAKEK